MPAPRPRGYGAVSFKTATMNIPEYRLREWHRHLKRIVDHAACDRNDTRTANALRLARRDLQLMDKIINSKDNDKT